MNIINISKEKCYERSKELYAKYSGIFREGKKYEKMQKRSAEIRDIIEERIDLKAVYAYFDDVELDGNTAIIKSNEVSFHCQAFTQIDPNLIKGCYAYVLTAGDYGLEEFPIIDQLYADLWGNAFTDAAREELEMLFRKDGKTSNDFGPGLFGMPHSEMHNLAKLVDTKLIDVEIKESGVIVPIKSCGGLVFRVKEGYEKLSNECETCLGKATNCNLCEAIQRRRT
ncbi:MAG: hypothetical protein ACRCUS_07975 [Anaerovoracaceae bacterium]